MESYLMTTILAMGGGYEAAKVSAMRSPGWRSRRQCWKIAQVA